MRGFKCGVMVLFVGMLVSSFQSPAFAAGETPLLKKADSHRQQVNQLREEKRLQEVPVEVQMAVQELRNDEEQGYTSIRSQGRTYLIVSLGQRPSTGYDVKIDQLLQVNSTVYFWTKETVPAEEEIVLPVLTTPITVVSFSGEEATQFHWVNRR